jgi:hypothetical protein
MERRGLISRPKAWYREETMSHRRSYIHSLVVSLVVSLLFTACGTEVPAPAPVELCEVDSLRCVAGNVWTCQADGHLKLEETCALNFSCVEDACVPSQLSLVEPYAWSVVPESEDPFWEGRPTDTEACVDFWTDVESSSPIIEGEWFIVNTGACNYVTTVQPLLHDIPVGAELEVQMHHYGIYTGNGPYRIVVAVGGDTAWEHSTDPVPLGQSWLQDTWISPKAYLAGTPVTFHLENHGVNEWAFFDLVLRQ